MIAKISHAAGQRWICKRNGEIVACQAGLGAADLLRGDCQPAERLSSIDDAIFCPPLFEQSRIFCVGRNYREHSLEMGSEPPANPNIFTRFAESYVGHQGQAQCPTVSEQYDYEGELVVVLKSGGRNLTENEAMGAIGGLTLAIDGSVRDYQKHSLFAGKNFEKSGAIGPWIMPFTDEIDLGAITLKTTVDGEQRQCASSEDFLFSVPNLIAYLSRVLELRAGDFLSTGTPAGVGAGFSPPKWLKADSTINVEATGIPALAVSVAA